MRTVDIHTHILPKKWPDLAERYGYGDFLHIEHHAPCCARLSMGGSFFREIESNCWDPSIRIQECNKDGVDLQVLSTVPVMFSYWAQPRDTLDLSRFLNDEIASVIAAHPTRFVGLGTVPMQEPDLAIRELDRCVQDLGMAGVQIGTHVNGCNLSDRKFFPFFERMNELGAALFIHPWDIMGTETMPDYWLPWLVGMPAETSRAICCFIFGGIFERLPNLRVAFAHGGGSFPSTIGRIEHGYLARPDLCAVDNQVNPRSYLGKFYLDSLVHDPEVLRSLIALVGSDRIALGSDYPFPLGELEPGMLIRSLSEIPTEEKERMLSGTALEWLGMADFNFE